MDEKDFLRVKKYTEAQGTSGFEHHVRDLFKADLTPLVDEVKQDGLGGSLELNITKPPMHLKLCLRPTWMKLALL